MSTTPDEATADPSLRLEEARELAQHGDLGRAAQLFEEVLALGDTPHRAQAALGLAVVREDRGDVQGAREADRIAISTKDPEYGPRAAYHLALSHQRTGERTEARDAWRVVADFGNPAYLPPAFLALGQIADADGDAAAARDWWERVIATGDQQHAPVAAHDLALRLLADGAPERAQQVLLDALNLVDRKTAPYAYARLALSLGIVHIELAIGAFGGALDAGVLDAAAESDPEVVPLATELLARTLPLRGRDQDAWEVWRRGLEDPRIAGAVRARLRREFGAEGNDQDDLWWEGFVESAVGTNRAPQLAGELFGALDHMYALVAMRYAEGPEGVPAETYDLLGRTVRVPSDYGWGRALHESFAERLRQAMGSDESVLPAGWPDEP